MDPPTEQIQSELENFREKWRAEVSARSRNITAGPSQRSQQQQKPTSTQGGTSSTSNKLPKRKATAKTTHQVEDDDDYYRTQTYDEPEPSSSKATGGHKLGQQDVGTSSAEKQPQTALDFYEEAVEKETTGKLGDSLQLYRKAFRMDDNVDQAYRNKYFPGRWNKGAQVNRSNAAVTVPNTAHHSLEGPTLSLPDLIASFSDLRIKGAPPECEGVAPPPCPVARLPDEILVNILRDVAIADVGDFVRLAQVCKRLAFLVVTEDQIWRRICLGSEFGFGGMHYHWQRGIEWEPLSAVELDDDVLTVDEQERKHQEESRANTNVLLHSLFSSSWQKMFRRRPRVRFNGCYISTVNYIRAGQASAHQITWNSPVHIVTYYRYLRLFRDGTAISLLTTDEPTHVVHHLTKENVALHQGSTTGAHLPSAVMSSALRGRWRLSSAADHSPDAGLADMESDLYVETEGVVGPKYMYRMELTFRSTGKAAARNNKLAWKGFWSYNKLTDDWAEFALKNDKPFFFSRVKSYGVGEL
ncbi:hypothetical protein GGR54DRAFT_610934 [Hypoxylon sp. NC1633]|nr:hypothetical protein GGR54DRAFT_610934 [Hypoxylon sp. NC1633]